MHLSAIEDLFRFQFHSITVLSSPIETIAGLTQLSHAIAPYYRKCAIARLLNSHYAIAPLTSMQSDTSDRSCRTVHKSVMSVRLSAIAKRCCKQIANFVEIILKGMRSRLRIRQKPSYHPESVTEQSPSVTVMPFFQSSYSLRSISSFHTIP